MYSLIIKAEFSSAHKLRGYQGKCESLHGHNWKVEIEVSSKSLDKTGMVCDFKELKERLGNILQDLDHAYLNELPYFSAEGARLPDGQGSASGGKKHNPTSENIARYIFDKFNSRRLRFKLEKVTVYESDSACAVYSKRPLKI